MGPHNLQPSVGNVSGRRSKGVDGMGAAKEAMNEGGEESSVDEGAVEKQKVSTEKVASQIRDKMRSGNQNLLRLVKPKSFISEGDEVEKNDSAEKNDKAEDKSEADEDEFQIPKSMKEIYRMSNKNRRKGPNQKSKKAPVYFSDDENDIEEDMTIEKAEELIAKSGPGGKDYFDANSPSKQQHTKSQDGALDQKDESKKDDVDLMVAKKPMKCLQSRSNHWNQPRMVEARTKIRTPKRMACPGWDKAVEESSRERRK